MSDQIPHACPIEQPHSRRGFLSTVLMVIGVAAGYGLGLLHFLEYLVPLRRKTPKREMFVGTLAEFQVGASVTLRDPRGEEISLTRVHDDKTEPANGFKALSSTCPHLGCKVHWDAGKGEFLCPCHNGVFDKNGIAVSGPPAKEKKNLSTFEVRVNKDTGWVYVMVSAGDDNVA